MDCTEQIQDVGSNFALVQQGEINKGHEGLGWGVGGIPLPTEGEAWGGGCAPHQKNRYKI